MNTSVLQLLVLAGVAIFLILRLRRVLGTREGFERPPAEPRHRTTRNRKNFEVIEGGPDRDIINHVEDDSQAALALAAMKLAEPGFSVGTFMEGARGAYEMILMGFEKGTIEELLPFLGAEVYESFAGAIDRRRDQGLTVEASFVGLREATLAEARFDNESRQAEIAVRFVSEMTSVVRDAAGEVVEGSATEIRRQKDVWTFARPMGADDPNWKLVATGE